jgi:hypothetical protein
MKLKFYLSFIFALGFLLTYAQWATIPNFQILNSNMTAVGVGAFTTSNPPLSRIHISNDLCNWPTGTYNGQLFRTDGNSGVDNFWRFYTGMSNNNQIERFRISVDANSFNTHLIALNPNLESEIFLGDADIRLNLGNYRIAEFESLANSPDEIQIGNLACNDQLGTTTIIHGDQLGAWNNGVAIWAQNHNTSIGNDYNSMPPNNVQLRVKSQSLNSTSASDYQSSEVIVDGRIDDDGLSYIRLQNASLLPNIFVPMLAGYQNGNSTGLVLSAKGPTTSDINNLTAMMEFDVRRGDSLSSTSVINRNLFRWCNYNQVPMLMSSKGRLGIKPNNTISLSNRVEIEAGTGDVDFTANAGSPGVIGASGLRFNKLNSQSATSSNPGNGLLSVNQTGDVIYVPFPTSLCTWDLLGANDLYTGVAPACRTGNVGIGTALPLAKLHVSKFDLTATTLVAERIDVNGGLGATTGLFSYAAGTPNSYVIGVRGVATGGVNKNVGGQFSINYSNSMTEGIGCLGQSNSNLGIGTHTGVKGEATGGKYNIAVNAGAQGNPGAISNTGLYAEATGTGSNWAIFANGAAGTIGGSFVVSDLIVKNNPTQIANSSEIINSLQPKSYTYKTSQYPNLNMPPGIHFGLLANNVAAILPHAVKRGHVQQMKDSLGNVLSDSLSFDMVNYIELIPILIDYVKLQQLSIDSLKGQLNNCCGYQKSIEHSERTSTHLSVTIDKINDCILFQNIPNPFGDKTQIKVLRSDITSKAEIVISTLNGLEIQRIILGNTNENIIDIDCSSLSNGIYLFSLLVNDEISDTKRMIKE